jgi:DNA-binding CsgD family transcriptional regulator
MRNMPRQKKDPTAEHPADHQPRPAGLELEVEMLRLAGEESLTAEQIGKNLGLAASRVRTYLSRLYSRLGAHNLIDAVREATIRGLLESVRVRPGVKKVELSDDELLSLNLAQQGRSSQEIAQALDVAEKTLRNRLSRTYRKLGVRNRPAAVKRAVELGLIQLDFGEGNEFEEIVRPFFPAGDDMVVEACLDPDETENGPKLRLRSRSQEAAGAVPLVVMLKEIKPLIDAITEAAEWITKRPAATKGD